MENRKVVIAGGGYTAMIRPDHGANCERLVHTGFGSDLLRTPPSEEAWRENPNLYGMPLLFPPNRIRDGRFLFRGHEYRFPINEPARNHHIHGFLSVASFETENIMENSASFVFRATREQPYLFFPHPFTVHLQYDLGEKGLTTTLSFRNDGEDLMPFGVGFHTAFNVPFLPSGRAEDCVLRTEAGKVWKFDQRILPTGETFDAQAYRDGVPCAHMAISELMDMGKSGAKAVLEDTRTGSGIVYEVGEGYRFWMLFNQGGERGYICVEPQTWIVDAPNLDLPETVSGFAALAPGEQKSLRTGIRFVHSMNEEA